MRSYRVRRMPVFQTALPWRGSLQLPTPEPGTHSRSTGLLGEDQGLSPHAVNPAQLNRESSAEGGLGTVTPCRPTSRSYACLVQTTKMQPEANKASEVSLQGSSMRCLSNSKIMSTGRSGNEVG